MTLHDKAPYAHVVTTEDVAERLNRLPWHRPECPEVTEQTPPALTNEPTFDDNLRAVTKEGVLIVRFQRAIDALRDRRFEQAHRDVLAGLLEDMGSKNGKCWTLRETLAERLGISIRTVNNTLYELRAWGYICWEKLPNPLDDAKRIFHYTVALALKPRADLQADITRAVEALRKSTPPAVHTPPAVYTAPGVTKCPAGGVKKPATLITEPMKEPIESQAFQKGGTTHKTDPTDFERFWKAFPPGRKIDKGDCRDLFDKITSGNHKTRRASAEVIIAAAERYAATKPDPKYTPAPKTWLNGGRWEDDVFQPQRKPTASPSGGVF